MAHVDKVTAHARDEATCRIESNFWDFDDVVDHIAFVARDCYNDTLYDDENEEAEDMDEDEARRIARRVVRDEWNKVLREQQTWPEDEETSADKLKRVFEELESEQGIITEMNFACCQRCGISELSASKTDPEQGYLFWHEQSTDRMMTGGGLALYFGNFGKGSQKSLEVANAAVKKLRDAGFSVKWDGTDATAITIDLVWRDRIDGDLIPGTEDEE